jgi:AraC family transcriptional regulator, regulatory protein of adaptative response / DNA-3-methyladenine glycosylase II
MRDDLQLDARVLDRARISRDARFDGKFFIAVTSTGIYCRPICPSRTSKPANVRYYATAAAAAEAGFRPCLRCRPEAAPGTAAWLGTCAVVNRALRMINEGALDDASVESLSARLGVSSRHLHRLFMRHVGAAPITVAQTRRLHFAKRLLDETPLPITQVALASGFGSVRRFNDAFRATYRRSPRELRAQRRGGEQASVEADEVTLRLPYRPPYDWPHMSRFLATVAIGGVERVTAYSYTRTITTATGHALASVRPRAHEHALELRISGAEPSALVQIASAARRMFDLAADSCVIDAALGADPLLGESVRRRPGLRIPGAWDPFECAVYCVLAERVALEEAQAHMAALVENAGRPIAQPVLSTACPEFVEGSKEACRSLAHTFPTPAAIAAADLEAIGLPKWKARALRELAHALLSGRRSPVDSEAVVQALTSIAEVSDWSLQTIALRSLSEPDAFPIDERALRSAALHAGTSMSATELSRRAEAWRPWRGYAAMHLWSVSFSRKDAETSKSREDFSQ